MTEEFNRLKKRLEMRRMLPAKEEFNLSSKIWIDDDCADENQSEHIGKDDVKEFIKRLKDELWLSKLNIERLNKLAGSKLI